MTARTLALVLVMAAPAPDQAWRGEPPEGPSDVAAPLQLTIARAPLDEWLALERDRLKLDRERFELERKGWEAEVSKKPSAWASVGGSAGIAALVTGLFGLVALRLQARSADRGRAEERRRLDEARSEERAKMREEVMLARSGELVKNRMRQYRKLWARLNRLSLYPLPTGLEASELSSLHERLKEWYFDLGGGMFLSLDRDGAPGSRTRYFALQRALREVRDELPGDVVLVTEHDALTGADAKADEDTYDGFRAESGLPSLDGNFARYRFLRALGSRLRSSIVEDLGTRAVPVDVPPPR